MIKAGYAVEPLDAYETIPDGTALAQAVRAHRVRPFDAIGFASPRGATAFLEAAGDAKAVSQSLIGAIGDTTRAALEAAGALVGVVPAQPSLAALLDGLSAALAARAKIE